jgi:dihydrolipoamide dehydrogenase
MIEEIHRYPDHAKIVTTGGKTWNSEMAFVAVGRQPDIHRLDLQTAGVEIGESLNIRLNRFCQSSNPDIYLVGDAAGGPMVANKALLQARIAALHATENAVDHYSEGEIVRAVYSNPQVAQVGRLEGSDLRYVRLDFKRLLKTLLLSKPRGFLELAYLDNGQIAGAASAGDHAVDTLAPAALAVRSGTGIKELAQIYAGHPSISEALFEAARKAEI